MKSVQFLAVFCLLLASETSLYAQATTPKAGTAERTAILDPVREPLQKAIGQKVIFVVDHMKMDGDWAFVIATPKTKNGGPISYVGTGFEDDANEADELTVALLRKKNGKWTLVEHAYFTTDVWWENLWENYENCPRSIFVQ
ncbi:hypothetical protein VSU19_04560 [Verrucomicrobiales bacterium BCK34]|nr:hypothetical protein [Verrucomicrobiales bacterium BCK34]